MNFVPTALSMAKKLSDSRSKYKLFVSLGIGDRKGTEIILPRVQNLILLSLTKVKRLT